MSIMCGEDNWRKLNKQLISILGLHSAWKKRKGQKSRRGQPEGGDEVVKGRKFGGILRYGREEC